MVHPRPINVALSVIPAPVGAPFVPPFINNVFPEPQSVVPPVPSRDTSNARIEFTFADGIFKPLRVILPPILFNTPIVPSVTEATFGQLAELILIVLVLV